jgi:flagellar motor switch protein FliN
MDDVNAHEAQSVDFPEVQAMDIPATAHLCMEDLASVPLFLTVELGTAKMKVRDVLELKVGSIVSLDKLAGEMTDVQLGSRGIARGEVVVLGDVLHVRLSEIFGATESLF